MERRTGEYNPEMLRALAESGDSVLEWNLLTDASAHGFPPVQAPRAALAR
jgi:hypothetical protein